MFCPFDRPLQIGTLERRYKRFLADIELDGETITAHCPNSGSMMGMKEPGSRVAVLHVPDPKRKLKWTWEMIEVDGTWVGCNTMRPNQIVEWAIREGHIPGLSADAGLRREVKYGNSRVDILLGEDHYVEVKNTTLARGPDADLPPGLGLFPDAVTARGTKHMEELAAVVAAGGQASLVFLVNRGDVDRFDVARDIDPTYGEAYDRAVAAGVKMLPFGVDVSPEGWSPRGLLGDLA